MNSKIRHRFIWSYKVEYARYILRMLIYEKVERSRFCRKTNLRHIEVAALLVCLLITKPNILSSLIFFNTKNFIRFCTL